MDEFEISNLIYRSAELFDQGQLVEAAELVRHATIKLHPDAALLTADELLSLWQSELSSETYQPTRQLISNLTIDINREQGRASCRSYYTLLEARASGRPAITTAGQYRDQLVLRDGHWQFAQRECVPLEANTHDADDLSVTNATMNATANSAANLVVKDQEATASLTNKGSPMTKQKAKILAAAQQIFSTVGYSEAGIRKIAELVNLSPTILFRQFGTKAGLFEAALIATMDAPKPPVAREHFGAHVANMLADPMQVNCPHAMSILATGNEESREIALRVLRQYAIMPMIEWLGGDNTESRAREIMALCAGFALYNSQLNITTNKSIDIHMVQWLARSIQAVVDEQ